MSTEYPVTPRLAVGTVVFRHDKLLLVKRAKAPSLGKWAVPGGSVALGETLQQAAEREVYEEAGIVVRASEPVYAFDLIERDAGGACRFHYVVVDVLAEYVSGELVAGDDVSDARWVAESELAGMDVDANTLRFLRQRWKNGGG